MKLNYRDRIVLTVVIVILVWVAGVMLIIKPSIEELKAAQVRLDDAKATKSDLEDRIEADKDLDKRIVDAYNEVTEMTKSFYSVQETQLASQLVDDLLDEVEILNLDMTISDYSVYVLNPYVYINNRPILPIDEDINNYVNQTPPASVTSEGEAPADGEAADAGAEGEAAPAPNEDGIVPVATTIGSYSISFKYSGTLDAVEEFCENMQKATSEKKEKTMVINSLKYEFAVSRDSDKIEISDTDVEGSMELVMMVIETLPDPNTLA